MTRISPPCSSSGRRGRAPARLEWRVPHPALPFPPPRRPDTPSARHAPACRGTAASGAAQPRSAPFFNELHQVRRERRLRLASYDHAVPFLLNDDLLAYLTLVGVRIIAPGVRSPAAYSPARRPNTSRSLRELPPSRLAPCIPPPTSPTAKSPEIVASCVSASTLTPPIM